MDEKLVAAARAAFGDDAAAIRLGAVVHEGQCDPDPIVRLPFAMLNRHGLVAGATGTGKTKTVQVMAEQLSAAGVPVFVADVKGDLSGIAQPGEPSARVDERAREVGVGWQPSACPVEMLSLTGALGAQLRATVSSFGPLALAKVLGLNETQTSVLALVFKYSDDSGLPLLDFPDLRAVLQYLSGPGAGDLEGYGVVSKASVGVLLRAMIELEQQGGARLFGEPEFDLGDLIRVGADGRGLVSVLGLADVPDKPALWSTFMMWMLVRLYYDLPEVGDADKPKLVFFFDEAHLLFRAASRAFRAEVEQVVRLIRSKGIGIFFCTQSPTDLPPEILGQLGCRVQHALRAFTADDDKALRAAARTFPKTPFYDIPSTLTTLGTGEALVTVISASGAPTPPFATRILPPASRMGPLTDSERARLMDTAQVRRYATSIDRDSAREMLARRIEERAPEPAPEEPAPPREERARRAPPPRRRPAAPDTVGQVLRSPVARTVATEVTRGLMGALFGKPPRRRRSW
jgi:DNA helicase HerA-like ATPase